MDMETFAAFCKAAIEAGTVTQNDLSRMSTDILRKLVAAGMYAERERCAKKCEEFAEGIPDGADDGARMCAAMLRMA